MLFQDIIDEWEIDQEFNRIDAGNAAIDAVKLQAKYIDYMSPERLFLSELTQQRDILGHDLTEWYLKREAPETRKKIGKKNGCALTIAAVNTPKYVAVDPLMITLNLNIARQDEKVQYIKSIIANLKDRGWGIKSYIEWTKFKSGQ